MEYKQAQEGIAKAIFQFRFTVPKTILEADWKFQFPKDNFYELADQILSLLFTPKEIEEWKKGGYPAIVCKDQNLPECPDEIMDEAGKKYWYFQAIEDMSNRVRIVKEE